MKQPYNSDLAQYQRFLGEKTKLRRQVTTPCLKTCDTSPEKTSLRENG